MPDPQTPRFGELLHRLLITKGYGQANVLDDYFPVIDMLASKAELFKLRDERTFVVGGRGIGAGGVGGRVWAMNKTANHLAVIEQMILSSPQMVLFADMTTIGLPADGAGGQSVGEGCDSRYGTGVPGTTPQAGITVANDTAGGAAGVPLVQTGATDSLRVVIPCRWVLKPGYALVISSNMQGVGADFTACFFGYVRGAEQSELT